MKLCPLVHHPFLVCHSERSEESAIVVKSFLENDDRITERTRVRRNRS